MMFSLSGLTVLLSAVSVLAVPGPQLRNEHYDLAKRVPVEARAQTFAANRVTWYDLNTGPDACTGKNHKDSDNIVAINTRQWGNVNSHSSLCGKTIKITANGVTAYGVIQDLCMTCPDVGMIDLTRSLFQKFASLDKGVVKATWSFVDSAPEEDPEPPKNTPKTTKTTKTTETTTERNTSTKKSEATPTKETETKPTKVAETDNSGDDDDDEDYDDDECEEYEDDEDDEDFTGGDDDDEDAPPPAATHKSTPTPKPETLKPPKVETPAKEPIKVDSTPSKIPVASSSTLSSSSTLLVAPTIPVGNPQTEPTPSQEPNGGISSDSTFGNGASSLSGNKALMTILAIVAVAIHNL